jgi:hypothetical protein
MSSSHLAGLAHLHDPENASDPPPGGPGRFGRFLLLLLSVAIVPGLFAGLVWLGPHHALSALPAATISRRDETSDAFLHRAYPGCRFAWDVIGSGADGTAD